MKPILVAAALLAVGAVSGCGASDAPSASSTSAKPTTQGQIVRSGFGQSGRYVQGIAEVSNLTDYASQTVVVTMSFYDASDELVKTATRTTSFSWGGQALVVPVLADLGSDQRRITRVEANLVIKDENRFDVGAPLPRPTPVTLAKDKYGRAVAQAQFTNTTDDMTFSLEEDAVCTNAAGEIVGGGSSLSDAAIRPGQSLVLEVPLTVSEPPAACEIAPAYRP